MSKPCIICVAITGSLPRKHMNAAVPISVAEQIESTQEAFEAGATICHAHVRNDDETLLVPQKICSFKRRFGKILPLHDYSVFNWRAFRCGAGAWWNVVLSPDMASLTVDQYFPSRVYENPPDLVDWLAAKMKQYQIKPEVEAFYLSHIHQAASMRADGRLNGSLYVQFVMGVKNAMPADRDVLIITSKRWSAFCQTVNGVQQVSAGISWR